MNIKKITLAVMVVGACMSAQAADKQIEFHIEGIQLGDEEQTNGTLYIQLFKGEQNYQEGKPAVATMVKPTSDMAVVNFQNLEAGEYAVRFFHDQNDNGELETNLFGLPTEGYGFSNNARPDFGPVKYKQAKFTLAVTDESLIKKTEVIY